jgi:hypothetical protein
MRSVLLYFLVEHPVIRCYYYAICYMKDAIIIIERAIRAVPRFLPFAIVFCVVFTVEFFPFFKA